MALSLSHGHRVWIKKVTHGRVAPNQNDALESITDTTFFQKPEKTFDCNVNHRVWSLFTSCAVNNMRYPYHRGMHDMLVRDAPSHYLQPLLWFWDTVVA